MPVSEFMVLLWTAMGIALLHTLAGPDHYLPFIVLSRARKWSLARTLGWTVICGFGHIASSVILGLLGALLGWSMARLGWFEKLRGGVAGWMLVVFGLIYMCYGLHAALKGRRHKHFDADQELNLYVYEHRTGELVPAEQRHKVTPWVMFLIFVLGPCEPMIPLLYVPGLSSSLYQLMILITAYAVVTLLAMTATVWLGFKGLALNHTSSIERYMHLLAGFAILLCGAGMVFMGW